MSLMKRYVLGFLFDEERRRVALILKNKPEWQAGHLNGIGGKIEANEGNHAAMVREFEEETGVHFERFSAFAKMYGDDWECFVFRGFDSDALNSVETKTDEIVSIFEIEVLRGHPIISNLNWLIPLAIDESSDGENPPRFAQVRY